MGIVNTDKVHGWANYGDSVKTEAAKLGLLAGVRTVISNDGISSFTALDDLPAQGDLWDSANSIFVHHKAGDCYMVRVLFKLDGAAASDIMVLGIRIKGASFDFIRDDIILPKAAGNRIDIVNNYMVFADTDSVNNGLELSLTAESNTNLWGVFFMITKIHNG